MTHQSSIRNEIPVFVTVSFTMPNTFFSQGKVLNKVTASSSLRLYTDECMIPSQTLTDRREISHKEMSCLVLQQGYRRVKISNLQTFPLLSFFSSSSHYTPS
jgi:hypothetical protein